VLFRSHTWGRLPDGVGPFTETEETLGAENTAPIVLGADLFVVDRAVAVDVDAAALDLAESDADPAFVFAVNVSVDGAAAVAGQAVQVEAGRFLLTFASTARLVGLESLELRVSPADGDGVDGAVDVATAGLASALYRGRGVLAPRVGLAHVTLGGVDRGAGMALEVIDGRALRRAFESTVHLYDSGDVVADFNSDAVGFSVVVGDDADRADLNGAVTAIAPFVAAPGLLAGAGDAFKLGSAVRMLAMNAWLGAADRYQRTQRNLLVHFGDDGEARLLPRVVDGAFAGGAVLGAGDAVFMRACFQDPDCDALFRQELGLSGDAALDLELSAQLTSTAAAARPLVNDATAFDAAIAAVGAELDGRSAVVAAELAP
jgi:hypothetical protein